MRRQQIITADATQVKRYAQYSLDAIRFAAHIVSYYNTDFIRCISLDYSTQQVYEQKRYLQAWDK